MNKLINNARLLNKDLCNIIEIVVQSYDTCITFKWVPLGPALGLAKAKDFNETVSIDIHEINTRLYYFYIIDEFTRYKCCNYYK